MDRDDTDSSTWYLPDGAVARLGKGNVMDMVLSPDGTLLAIGSYLGLWWYDVPNCSLLTLWEAGKTITTVAFSACGEWVATGGWGAPIKIWDVKRGNCLAELARDKKRLCFRYCLFIGSQTSRRWRKHQTLQPRKKTLL